MKVKTVYYTDELNDEFSDAKITPRRIDGRYKYCHDSLWRRFTHFFWYKAVAAPIAFFYMKIRHRHRVVGKELMKPYRKCGYFMFGNHTHHLCDAVIPGLLSLPKSSYVIVHPNNVSMAFLGRVTSSMGALPLPDNLAAYKNFSAAIVRRYKEGATVTVYPEAHIWPYYTGIRPFKDDSFSYPVKLNSPVFSFTNTYQKRKGKMHPRIVTYIDGPFFPDSSLPTAKARKKLRDEVYTAMCERAKLSNAKIIEYIKKDA